MTLRQTQQQLSLGALIWVGSLTVLACISANTIIRTIAVTFFGVPDCSLSAPFCWSTASANNRYARTAFWRLSACSFRCYFR
jgi:hypothetical protein